MAKVSFETAQQYEESRPSGSSGGLFEFFNLKNDGDFAVVRFLYSDVSEFDIFTCHNVTINGKYRKVSCIREPHDSTEACPLCASGNNISNRFFIKMLEYRMNASGQMEVHPVVWERSMSYASRLKSMLDEYGPLKDCLFKVKRNGAAGSMDTTYDILFCSPKVYSDASYPMIPNAFEGVNILGTLVLNKSYQDIETFLATGAFPQNTNNQQTANVTPPQYTPKANVDIQVDTTPAVVPVTQQPYVVPQVPDIPQPPVGVTPPVVTNVPQQPVPTGMGAPVTPPAQPAMQRPVRYY